MKDARIRVTVELAAKSVRQADGTWRSSVPRLPGVQADAPTEDEALIALGVVTADAIDDLIRADTEGT